jgi:hypothetical protein
VQTTAVSIVLAIDLEGQPHVLGHWIGDGAEGATFWLSVVTDLQTHGVQDILIACVDGLSGFKEALPAVFRRTQLQRSAPEQLLIPLHHRRAVSTQRVKRSSPRVVVPFRHPSSCWSIVILR